jgi:hypothetical protein
VPVKQRGDSWQVDFRHSGERIRKSFDSEVKALQWEAWAKMRLSKGEPLKEVAGGEVQTMRSLCQACCARYWRGTPNESNAIRNAEEMVDLLGAENHPKDIKPSDIDRVIGVLRERGNSAGTINRKLSALGKMFTHAVTRGIIDRKPHWDSIKESQGRLRWFTPEEESLILGWLHQNGLLDFRDLVVFLLDTGCRLGEACPKDDRKPGLLWRDVDDTYARFHETKGGGSRAVPGPSTCGTGLGLGLGGRKTPKRCSTPCGTPAPPGWSRTEFRFRWFSSGWGIRR